MRSKDGEHTPWSRNYNRNSGRIESYTDQHCRQGRPSTAMFHTFGWTFRWCKLTTSWQHCLAKDGTLAHYSNVISNTRPHLCSPLQHGNRIHAAQTTDSSLIGCMALVLRPPTATSKIMFSNLSPEKWQQSFGKSQGLTPNITRKYTNVTSIQNLRTSDHISRSPRLSCIAVPVQKSILIGW